MSYRHNLVRALHGVALDDVSVGTEEDDAHVVGLEVEGHAADAGREHDHLTW